jgi:excisionase family DNA binding protein
MTIGLFFREQHTLASRWAAEAATRRKLWAEDPVAATLAHQAAELEELLRRLELELARMSVAEFADERGVSPQTVTRWIREGYLAAVKTPEGYRIRRGARMVRKAQHQAAA